MGKISASISAAAVLLSSLSLSAQAQFDANDAIRLGVGILQQITKEQQRQRAEKLSSRAQRPSQAFSHAAIRELQRLLNGLGYAAGPIDGELGPNTRAAIRSFQRSSGLNVTGEPDFALLDRLRSTQAHKTASGPARPGPGFDCHTVSTATEGAICASPELAALDQQLSSAYYAAMEQLGSSAVARLRSAQRQWIADRNSCGADTACIATVYRNRIAALRMQSPPAVAGGSPRLSRPAGSATFNISKNYDLPKGDYRSGVDDPRLREISATECQQMCGFDNRCRAFTYNVRKRVCFLKDSVSRREPSAGAISGIKLADRQPVGPRISALPTVKPGVPGPSQAPSAKGAPKYPAPTTAKARGSAPRMTVEGIPADILAPAGIRFGMTAEEAQQILVGSGFRKDKCHYVKNTNKGKIQILLLGLMETRRPCTGIFTMIDYIRSGFSIKGSAEAIADKLVKLFGAAPTDCASLQRLHKLVACTWGSVPNSSLIERATVGASGDVFNFTLMANKNSLNKRISSTSKAKTVSSGAPISPNAQTIAENSSLIPAGGTADGLVICSRKEIFPLTRKKLENIFVGNQQALEELRTLSEGLGIDAKFLPQRIGDHMADLSVAVEKLGKPFAYHDKGVVSQPDGREIGEVGKRFGVNLFTKYCKLAVNTSAQTTDQSQPSLIRKSKDSRINSHAAKPSNLPDRKNPREVAGSQPKYNRWEVSNIDPLIAPKGLAIGQPVWQAKSVLKGKGYSVKECSFSGKLDSGATISIRVMPTGKPKLWGLCYRDGIIMNINYTAYDIEITEPISKMVSRISSVLGVKPDCRVLSRSTKCLWHSPPAAPLLRLVYLEAGKHTFDMQISGFGDRVVRVAAPDEPQREKHWWEAELAKANQRAKRVALAVDDGHAGLSPGLRTKITEEARSVEKYCRGMGLFAAFHDCRCVAEQFIDKRVEIVAKLRQFDALISQGAKLADANRQTGEKGETIERWRRNFGGHKKPSHSSLIALADKVAHQCPNKAGVASYGYQSCVTTHGYRLPDNGEVFCTCFAEHFVKAYMEDPRTVQSAIVGMRASAMLSCSKKASPNPLQ